MKLPTRSSFISGLASIALFGCAVTADDQAEDGEQDVGTTYVHISEFSGIDQGAWFDLAHRMNDEFRAICSDTFCEGEYTNITPLTVNCAVSSIRGSVRDCAWTFSAAQAGVDANTAAIGVDAPTWECHFHPKTTARALIGLLVNADNAIETPLPGMGASIYDTLGECFFHPIGGTPITVASSPTPTYLDADNYYTSPTYVQRWDAAKAALVAGFDRVCGDTFCSSDYSDLQAMRLVCAVTKSTGNVKACDWVFGGSYSVVSTAGAVVETAHTYRCPLTVHGTLAQLMTTLTATSTVDPIRRPLPGTTATAYDGLLGCLP